MQKTAAWMVLALAAHGWACGSEGDARDPDVQGIGYWGDVGGEEGFGDPEGDVSGTEDAGGEKDAGKPEPPKPTCVQLSAQASTWTYFSKSCEGAPAQACCGVDLGTVIAARVSERSGAVDTCVMELQDFTVSDALIAAHNKGRQVRVVVDDSYSDPAQEKAVQQLEAAGIVPVADTQDPNEIMHHKFMVLDSDTTLISSGNFSTYDAASNANNLVLLESQELATLFRQRFEKMWSDGVFHETSGNGPFSVWVGGQEVEVIFGPSKALVDRLVAAVKGAKHAVHFSIFSFTLDEVKSAILSRCGEVEILGVYDADQETQADSVAVTGWCAQADVRRAQVSGDFGYKKLHHKVLLVDPGQGGLVVTGSANWSYSAATKNDETMVVLHDPAVVVAFEAEFQARHNEAAQ
jgi:hypothetical protein